MKKQKFEIIFFLSVMFIILLLSSTLYAQNKQSVANNSSMYKIQVNDVLEIHVWKEENLTRDVQVRRDGRISLPLVDEIQAAGRNPVELKKNITQILSQYIENPVVTVIVKEQGSTFYIIGEVVQIGAYPLVKNISFVQALSLAGGFTEWADKDKMLLIRRVNGEDKRYIVSYNDIIKGKKPKDNFILQPNDTIVVY
jgi:polysaccharide export outer membrane protein